MPGNFHGSFVFRKQDHNILSSTYFNINELKPFPETAILKEKRESELDHDFFAGLYQTTWLERDAHYVCDLEIRPTTTPRVYELSWKPSNISDKVRPYTGFGMLENGLLVGFYY